MSYNTSKLDIVYHDNKGYREAIREVFQMNNTSSQTLLKKEDIDEESWDEWIFDSDTVTNALNTLYEKTEDHPLFAELYEIAAAQMISTDPKIGQAVLMSYDYFRLFHPCLCVFLNSPDAFNETSRYYIQLKYALTK